MCGRYYIDPDDAELCALIGAAQRQTGVAVKAGEVFPCDVVPVVVAGNRVLPMRWGFTHNGKTVINARSEAVAQTPLFQAALLEGRCLIPAQKYFEWENLGAKKRKYAVSVPAPMLFMAGLYRVEEEGGLPVFVILTRTPAPALAFLHERMPVILPREAQHAWLDGDFGALRDAEGEYRFAPV